MNKKKLSINQIILLFSLYTTQYLGLAFFSVALIGILRQEDMPLEQLGLIYMLGLFWVFRFLWAPFIDKIKFKNIGHYKGWIIIFQSLMVIVLIAISMFDVATQLSIIIFLSLFFAFFASSQNIALDALVYKSTFKSQRSLALSIKTSSGLIGMVLGGGVGLIIYSYTNWQYTILLISFVTSLSLIQLFFYKEPQIKEKIMGENKIDFRQYIEFWRGKKRKMWLVLLLIYPASIASAYGMTTPILVDLGWSLDKIGYIVNIIGYGFGIIASFCATWFIKYFGKKNSLVIAAIGQSIGALLLLVLFYDSSDYVVMFVVGFIFVFYTPSAVIMSTLMMNQASKKSPAAQFAIQHSFFMFAGIFFTSISLTLSGIFGYSNVIIICSLIGGSAALLSLKIENITKKEVQNTDDRATIISPST
ncbi:MFS transporter [Halarcobacter ebronensis]|uniref:MFS transporter n=1 Tax=Halarcobacter ebronensis TaxID=1462615 RepID=A0A4Q1AYH5_9BACT|nr:MFS transporter [Halarcobacter ebronensis]QKF82736.1 major facilitator superfamily transporter [Halarcobacter ebronensis]RXK06761.1 MFS transporter [Halarcobacter ebronensis]